MNKYLKRLLASTLAVTLLMSAMSISALAADGIAQDGTPAITSAAPDDLGEGGGQDGQEVPDSAQGGGQDGAGQMPDGMPDEMPDGMPDGMPGGGGGEGGVAGVTGEGAPSEADIVVDQGEVTADASYNGTYTVDEETGKVTIEGVNIYKTAYEDNGIVVNNGSTAEIKNAKIIMDVKEMADSDATAGLGVAVDNGSTLYITDSEVVVNGAGRYTIGAYNDALMVVNNSTIVAGGKLAAAPYTDSISDARSNAALLISGTSRSNFSIGKSHTFYYGSSCIAEGWAALSTDSATGTGLELVAYNTYAEATHGGYGTYADTNCRDYLYGVVFNTAEVGAIISNNGEINVGSGADAKNDTTQDGYDPLAYAADGYEVNDGGSVIYAARNCFQMHSPDMMGSGSKGYAAVLNVKNSKLTTVASEGLDAESTEDYTEKYGTAVGAYVDYIKGSVLLIKSTGAEITLNNVEMESSNGILIHSVINSDSMSRFLKAGSEDYAVNVSMTDMDVKGDIVHDDYQRDMNITLDGTTLEGAVTAATADSWEAQWAAYADQEAAYWTTINNDTYNTETHATTLTLKNGAVWNVTATSTLTALDVDETSTVNGKIIENADGTITVTPNGDQGIIQQDLVLTGNVTYPNGIVLAEGVSVTAADEDKLVTMTVNGVQQDIVAGTYEGEVTFTLTPKAYLEGPNMGQTYEYEQRAAQYYLDGQLVADRSVTDAVTVLANQVTKIQSTGKNFNGVFITGTDNVKSTTTLKDLVIDLSGYGENDMAGVGAALYAVGTDVVADLNNINVTTSGATRTALFAGGGATVNLNESSIYVYGSKNESGALPEGTTDLNNMEVPWMLGLIGDCRATNVLGSATVNYNDSVIVSYDWGALSTDSISSQYAAGNAGQGSDNHVTLNVNHTYVATLYSGYGAYADGGARDIFTNSAVDVADIATIMTGNGEVSFYDSYVNAGSNAVMVHAGGGGTINAVGSEFHVGGVAFLVKDSAMTVNISDSTFSFDGTAEIDKDLAQAYGVDLDQDLFDYTTYSRSLYNNLDQTSIVKVQHNADAGSGSDQTQTAVVVNIEDSDLVGDIINTSASTLTVTMVMMGNEQSVDRPARSLEVSITDSSITGAISLGEDSWDSNDLVTVSGAANEFKFASDTTLCYNADKGFGLDLTLTNSVWNVTETSYLTSLTLEGNSVINGVVEQQADGTYIVYPKQAVSFTDVAESDWFCEPVIAAAQAGIISGFGDGTFRPNESLTRAQAVTMIALASGLTIDQSAVSGFSDANGDWYTPYVAAAAQAGIVNGYEDGTFKPNQTITRAELTTMIALSKGLTIDKAAQSAFVDGNGAWYTPYLAAAQSAGVISGYEDGTFKPTAQIKRSEAAQMIFAAYL